MRDMSKLAQVYVHTSPDGKVYVGCTSTMPPETRWGEEGIGYIANNLFYADIQKFGWDAFTHEIITSRLPRPVAEAIELALIHVYKAIDPAYGYNVLGKFVFLKEKPSCWIHKHTAERMIEASMLNYYIDNGWTKGKIPHDIVYIHRGDETRRVHPDKLEDALQSGWQLGKSQQMMRNAGRRRQEYIWKVDNQEFTSAKDVATYLREHYYPHIVPSTITAAFLHGPPQAYPDLLRVVTRKRTNNPRGRVSHANH